MKIIVAPDSFKDSLTASQACQAIAAGIRRVVPDAQIVSIPMADGGEGTVDALVAATAGRFRTVTVIGPLAQPVEARYGILHPTGQNDKAPPTAVIEMAGAAGLPLVPSDQRNPLYTTTYGLGQLILDALDQHCRHFIIGIGGSATNDCGTGMAQALGVRFFDRYQKEITNPMTGQLMGQVTSLDTGHLHPHLAQTAFTIACDVKNPLLGPQGASTVYGPQKGADPQTVALLEANMAHIIGLIETKTARQVRDIPGAGAAGGLGAGLMAFLNASLQPGIEIVIRQTRFTEQIHGADLIFTGEGRIDGQTVFGKTIAGIAHAAAGHAIPVIALAGCLGEGVKKALDLPLAAYLPICPGPITLQQAIQHASDYLADTAEQATRLALLKCPDPT